MKFLFDQNLSFRLTEQLGELDPCSVHVKDKGFEQAADTEIWNYAKENACMIVSKDSNFHQRSLLLGPPPKVVWIRKSNCSTLQIIDLLKKQVELIRSFVDEKESSFLVLG